MPAFRSLALVVGVERTKELKNQRTSLVPLSFTRYNSCVELDDTIVAIATPTGRGGVGIVRLAGPQARAIAEPMLRLKPALEPRRAVVGDLADPEEPINPLH